MHDKIYVYLTIGQILNLDEKQGLWDARINFYSRYFLPENVWYGNGSNFPECILVPQGTAWGPTLSMKSSLFSCTLIWGWQGARPPSQSLTRVETLTLCFDRLDQNSECFDRFDQSRVCFDFLDRRKYMLDRARFKQDKF